jgi:hypothetical protein
MRISPIMSVQPPWRKKETAVVVGKVKEEKD